DAREIEELIALPEWRLASALRRALDDRDAITDRGHDLGAASGELLGRKRVGETLLRVRRTRDERDGKRNRAKKARVHPTSGLARWCGCRVGRHTLLGQIGRTDEPLPHRSPV